MEKEWILSMVNIVAQVQDFCRRRRKVGTEEVRETTCTKLVIWASFMDIVLPSDHEGRLWANLIAKASVSKHIQRAKRKKIFFFSSTGVITRSLTDVSPHCQLKLLRNMTLGFMPERITLSFGTKTFSSSIF
jgi:hypothetical protein